MIRQAWCARSAWTTAALLSGILLPGRAGADEKSPPPPGLAGTEWRLVEIQSMDDSVGTTKPSDPSAFTMQLDADGTVHMRLDCNRANGTWKAEPGASPASGRFEFGPLAGTRALCPPPRLDEKVTAQAQYVRSYLLKDGRLYLSLMADGGIQAWEPVPRGGLETTASPEVEAAIRKASPSYTRAVVEAGGPTARARYVYARVDLSGDGRDEVLVYAMGSFFCGTGGCNLLVLAPGQKGYAVVDDFPITQTPVVVSDHKTAGWSDLFRLERGGGARAAYVRHVFDGKHYVEKERLSGDTVPAGRRVIPDDVTIDKGIPLEPGEGPAPPQAAAPTPSATGFATVCGVTVEGKEYRYRCTVEGARPGPTGRTTLHFPDNEVTLEWQSGGRAAATFAGMNPQDVTVATTGGVTRFTFEGKEYFYVSDPRAAAEELKTLR